MSAGVKGGPRKMAEGVGESQERKTEGEIDKQTTHFFRLSPRKNACATAEKDIGKRS